MNEVFKDATSIIMAIVGVAILTVLVSKQNQTPTVLNAGFQGLSNLLGVAMGAAPTQTGYSGFGN